MRNDKVATLFCGFFYDIRGDIERNKAFRYLPVFVSDEKSRIVKIHLKLHGSKLAHVSVYIRGFNHFSYLP